MAVQIHTDFEVAKEKKAICSGAENQSHPFGSLRVLMNQIAVTACVLFALAVAVESAVRQVFLHRLKMRHARQWTHAAQSVLWTDRASLSARNLMLYLQHKSYLASSDLDGKRYCGRHRAIMLAAYWFTAIAGVAALTAIAMYGW